MKYIIVIAFLYSITGCATVTYHNAPDDVADACREKSTYQTYNASSGGDYGQSTMGPELDSEKMRKCLEDGGYEIREQACDFSSCDPPSGEWSSF